MFKRYSYYFYIAIFIFIVAAFGLLSFKNKDEGVVINEVCTSNVTCCKDDNGDFPDWVELYNPTQQDIDLSGYIFTKSTDVKKKKYVIPEGTVISPGSYHVFDPGFVMPKGGCTVTLSDENKHIIDRVSVPGLLPDSTYSRYDDGSAQWAVKDATPGYSNSDGIELAAIVSGNVAASHPSGFYDEDVELSLFSSNPGRQIYYTLDGTDPVKNGIKYDSSISITDRSGEDNVYCMIPEVSKKYTEGEADLPSYPVDKCTVVRCVAKDLLGRYTEENTFMYFIGYSDKKAYDNMAVISVCADPDDLFSYEDGIMVLGKDYDRFVEAGQPEEYGDFRANFENRGRRTEKVISLEIFDEDHDLALDTKAGIRIKGLSSRWNVQKSFNVTFHKAFGSYSNSFSLGGMDLDLHSFALDKGGQDTGSKMKDTIMEYCMASTTCATTDRIPCCLFLNGEYWGFYWFAQRFDRTYLADRYDVAKEDIVITDMSEYEKYSDWPYEDFDRESLIDYYAANIIVAHEGDWPHMNFRLWQTAVDEGSPCGDGKMRPIIFDMNSDSMELADFDSFYYLTDRFPPFVKMVEEDPDFKTDLLKRIDEMSAGEFEKYKMIALINDLYDRMNDQMVLDKMRYSDCSKEEAQKEFDESVGIIWDFYENRWQYLLEYKEKYANEK